MTRALIIAYAVPTLILSRYAAPLWPVWAAAVLWWLV